MSNNHVLVKNRKKKNDTRVPVFPLFFLLLITIMQKKKTLKSDWNTVLHASA